MSSAGSNPSASVAPTQLLLRALIQIIENSRSASTHLRETGRFLEAIQGRLRWYDGLLHRIDRSTLDVPLRRAAISQVGQLIYHIIEYIKGLCEGTTDRIPFEFATLLNRELRTITGTGQDREIALFPVSSINYFYLDVGEAVIDRAFDGLDRFIKREIISQWSSIDPTLDPLPSLAGPLILVGFQYAMVEDILFNAVLFHELGHHVFKQSDLNSPTYFDSLKTEINDRLILEVRAIRESSDASEREKTLSLAHSVAFRWVNELFSDAFAVAISGPQFGFASRDLFRIRGSHARPESFARTHPATLLREEQQFLMMRELDWNAPDSEHISEDFTRLVMDAFADLVSEGAPKHDDVRWKFDDLRKGGLSEEIARILVDVIQNRCAHIRAEARKSVPDARLRRNEFWAIGPMVMKALNLAIVPSTILMSSERPMSGVLGEFEHTGDGVYRCFPHPSTTMNVARVLYQTGCEVLLKIWNEGQAIADGREETTIHIHKRLSQWTQKAIGDWLLLTKVNPKA